MEVKIYLQYQRSYLFLNQLKNLTLNNITQEEWFEKLSK